MVRDIKKTIFKELTFQACVSKLFHGPGLRATNHPVLSGISSVIPLSTKILQGCQVGVKIQIRFQKGETQKDKC